MAEIKISAQNGKKVEYELQNFASERIFSLTNNEIMDEFHKAAFNEICSMRSSLLEKGYLQTYVVPGKVCSFKMISSIRIAIPSYLISNKEDASQMESTMFMFHHLADIIIDPRSIHLPRIHGHKVRFDFEVTREDLYLRLKYIFNIF